MRKKLLGIGLSMAAALLLCGCGSVFAKEYLAINDYVPASAEEKPDDGKVTVRNFAALKAAILDYAYAGSKAGVVVFDQNYSGDIVEDMASACWQVRTQDALCAYCVENIAYEINKIVAINEASIYISYSDYGESPKEIIHLYYSSGIANMLKEALSSGDSQVVALVNRSSYGAEQIDDTLREVYRKNPTLVPKEPTANVVMFSGTGSQRLYEISINYGMTETELQQRRAQIQAVDAFDGLDLDGMSEGEKALAACTYLMENCAISSSETDNTAYAALVNKRGDSEGLAFAYVELCKQLKLDCRIVYGQRSWSDHCWNIVKVDGSYYHVDVSSAITNAIANSFLLSDEEMWGDYRWDVASYPKCTGQLRYNDFVFE